MSLLILPVTGQEPYRMGTTAGNFLEIGFGSAGSAMGDAYVAMVNDLSAAYWNPAGLAFMKQSEAQFIYQPLFVGINTAFTGAGFVVPSVGTVALSMLYTGYGDMDVTTVEAQEGTGETFTANDYAFTVSYARKLTNWFSFGASGKYVGSEIWHTKASALALDLGVIVNTFFLSPTGERKDGMHIGMSISNYGTRMRYDGIDLINPIDILPDQNGNYADTKGQFRLEQWELPLIFRIGTAINVINTGSHKITMAVDALHPNNNSEYVNAGMQYALDIPNYGLFYLRAGYKGMFMPNSEYGLALGGGMEKYMMNNLGLKIDYAYRDVGLLGRVHSYSVGFLF
ncbi:MAG: PorV/PorQ family protein [Caldithrix sp.]|nr:PorV/PorQ family protein [Caldithrix sp.]